jgi:hypothetical protein
MSSARILITKSTLLFSIEQISRTKYLTRRENFWVLLTKTILKTSEENINELLNSLLAEKMITKFIVRECKYGANKDKSKISSIKKGHCETMAFF